MSFGKSTRGARSRVLLLLAIALLPVNAAADELQEVLVAIRDPQLRESIGATILEARDEGLPEGILLSRTREGIAKNVDGARLLATIRDDVDRLSTARRVIAGIRGAGQILSDPASWERAATLLRAGWDEARLAHLAAACEARPAAFREASSFALAVEAWGVPPDLTMALTSAVVESTVSPADYPAVASLLGGARERRIDPERAATMLIEGLARRWSLGRLRTLFDR